MHKKVIAITAMCGLTGVVTGIAWNTQRDDAEADATPVVSAAVQPAGAPAFDDATATLISQDEWTQVWSDAAGVNRAEVSLVPLRVERDGAWISASNQVTQTGGVIVAEDHPLVPEFPAELGDEPIVSVDTGGYSIEFSLDKQRAGAKASVQNADASEDSSTITYPNAVAGADAVYEVTAGMVKESFVVGERPDAPIEFSWVIEAPGLTLARNEFGGIDLAAPDGEVVAHIPSPAMWDSSGDADARGIDLVNVDYSLDSLGDGRYRFALVPDTEWLGDAAREYPVYVDPSVTYGSNSLVGIKFDGSTYGAVRIGNPKQASGWTAWRSVAHYPYENLYGYRITNAAVKTTVTSGTANCYDGGLWTATAISYAGIGDYLSPFPNCSTGDAASQTLASYVAYLTANRFSNAYFMLAGDEGNSYSYKQLSTTMIFEYVNQAVTTGVTGPSPRKTVSSDPVPTVDASDVVIEPVGTYYAGTGQVFRYTLAPSSGASWTSPWVQAGPYRIPDGVLAPGSTYTYTIETMDNFAYASPITTNNGQGLWTFRTRGAPTAPASVTIGGLSLHNGAVVTDTSNPTLKAVVGHPDGGKVWALFTVKRNGIVIVDSLPGTSQSVPAGGSFVSTAEFPYAIDQTGIYTVEVRAFDGYMTSAVLAPPGSFAGPLRESREIPGDQDAETEAAS